MNNASSCNSATCFSHAFLCFFRCFFSPGIVTDIIHGAEPSAVADNYNDSLGLDAETATEESKGSVTNHNTPNDKEIRLVRRVSLSSSNNSSSSDSSVSSSSNESTIAIIYETLDDIICRIENKELAQQFMVQIQQNEQQRQARFGGWSLP